MGLTWGAPGWLWCLLLLPLVWVARRGARTGFSPRQGRVQAVVRACLVATLVFALARPVISVSSSSTAIVYLVDVSHSVASRGIETAADTIDRLKAALAPADTRIVAFGRTAAPLPDTAALRRLAGESPAGVADPVGRDGTNLEQALAVARAELPPGTNGRILLFSDGHDTEGSSHVMADRLAADRVPVFATPLPPRDLGDTWVDAVRAPTGVPDGASAPLTVTVGSQRAGHGIVTVRERTRLLARVETAYENGRTRVPVDVTLHGQGPHLLEAEVATDTDVLAINNRLTVEVLVTPRTRILYAQATTASAALPTVLGQAGFEVTTTPPNRLPTTTEGFDSWDAVVLSNVSRTSIPAASMTAIDQWVQQRGGGLLFAGGGAVFGESSQVAGTGFRRTAIENVLPVTFEREDTPEVALVVVLDRSWSMYGDSLALCKAAADQAVDSLADTQVVGVITFNNEYEWNVPLAPVRGKRAEIHKAIGSIAASGPTLIYPALQQAYLALSAVHARAKHVVLLSDGQTEPDDYAGLLKKMAAARITVSSVALGPEADVKLLGDIATWGKGQSYVVPDAKQLPQIFVKEAKNAATPGFEAGGTMPLVSHQPDLFRGPASGLLPSIRGRNAVTSKPGAIDLVSTPQGDPVLTVWPAGLGRAAMFATDLDGTWTADWLSWRGFGGFFATVLRLIARPPTPPLALSIDPGPRDGTQRAVEVTLDARDRTGRFGNLLSPSILVGTERGTRSAALAQVAPGRYEATVVVDASLPATVRLTGIPEAPEISRMVPSDTASEYRFNPPDQARLAALARATGGRLDPTPEDVRNAPHVSGRTHEPLTPWLLAIALVCWLGDVVVRRVRF
jgi:Ca-activated chloride channel homolog